MSTWHFNIHNKFQEWFSMPHKNSGPLSHQALSSSPLHPADRDGTERLKLLNLQLHESTDGPPPLLRTLRPASPSPAAPAQQPVAGAPPPLAAVFPPLAPLVPAPPSAPLCSPPHGRSQDSLNSQNSLNLAGVWSLWICPLLLAQSLLQLEKNKTKQIKFIQIANLKSTNYYQILSSVWWWFSNLQSLSSSEAFRILERCSGSVMFSSLRWGSFSPAKSSRFWKPCMKSKEVSSCNTKEHEHLSCKHQRPRLLQKLNKLTLSPMLSSTSSRVLGLDLSWQVLLLRCLLLAGGLSSGSRLT